MLLCDCVCVSLSLSQTHSLKPTHPHTQDVKVLSRLDSPLLPPLPVRGLSAGDQDDSLRFPEDTYMYFSTSTVHVCVCTYIYQIQESVYVSCESGRSNTHAQVTLPSPFPLSLSLFPSLFPPFHRLYYYISWKASRLGTDVTQMDFHSSALGLQQL